MLHTPFGTPVQFAFTSAMDICKRLGIAHLVINDPGKRFAPDVRHMGPMALSPAMQADDSAELGAQFPGRPPDPAYDPAY